MWRVLPLSGIAVNQLHDELLAVHPAWNGTLMADGSFRDPLIHVEATLTELRIFVPDGDEAIADQVIKAHVPGPTLQERKRAERLALQTKLKTRLQLTDAEVNLLMRR